MSSARARTRRGRARTSPRLPRARGSTRAAGVHAAILHAPPAHIETRTAPYSTYRDGLLLLSRKFCLDWAFQLFVLFQKMLKVRVPEKHAAHGLDSANS